MNPIESLYVDNSLVRLTSFAVPSMSLSSSRSEMLEHSFVVTAKSSELVRALEPAYQSWVSESKQDDDLCGRPQDELSEAGYPPLDRVLQHPRLLELVVGNYLLNESLGKFTWDGISTVEYWFDRVTRCHLAGNDVIFSGVCYSRP